MKWRYRLVLFCFLLSFLLVVVRLFYWQVVKAEELSSLGKLQYNQSKKLFPKRGEILSSDGFPLATNKISYLVYANPKQIKEKEKTTELLSSFLSMDKATISAKLSLDKLWVPIKPRVSDEIKDKIEKLDISGIGFEEQYIRFYPEASLAAQLIGFVAKDEVGDDKGYFGLEGFYDRHLKGKAGVVLEVKDALGNPILAKTSEDFGRIHGRTLLLNIDRTIQFIVERSLKKGMENYGASGAMAAVLDPKTGGVMALASFPSFDQRIYGDFNEELYKNPYTTSVYEPGSTFKPIVMASAIDAGVVEAHTKCNICSGPIELAGYEIKTWNDKYYPNSTMIDVIQHSDNTGMVFVSKKLGREKMLSYFDKFGIGKGTGIDLQGESVPTLRSEENWKELDLATASFGQGMNVTAIELLTAFSAIANDGKMMKPQVVSQIKTAEGEVLPIEPVVLSQPISEKTAKVMTEILVNAVEKGESQWIKPKGYKIAGKTGTAQIPIAGHYDPNKTIASFIGFAPAYEPKFSMLVVVDRPTTSIYGSETAAPIFMEIARDLFAYFRISPSE